MKEKAEEKAEGHGMKKDSEDSEEEKKEEEEEEEEEELHPVSEPSPSLPALSPFTPHCIRSSKSPSPPLHSPLHSPISDGHSSVGHGGFSPTRGKRFAPPPRKPRIDSSPESSISSDHCSVGNGIPPIGGERFSPAPQEKPAASPVVVANRFQVEPKAGVTKVDPGAEEGVVSVKDAEQGTSGGGGGSVNGRLRPDVFNLLRSKKEARLNKNLLGLRITAFVFCLISFSVLAADRKQGWALDSFYSYKEFKYSLSVNVIGFVYSGLQICDIVKYLITRKHIVENQLRVYFSFAMDQILTYLLMSASSSAATRAYDWESNWGKDKFPDMANASVGLSFVAFVAFSLASLVSGYILCRFR